MTAGSVRVHLGDHPPARKASTLEPSPCRQITVRLSNGHSLVASPDHKEDFWAALTDGLPLTIGPHTINPAHIVYYTKEF